MNSNYHIHNPWSADEHDLSSNKHTNRSASGEPKLPASVKQLSSISSLPSIENIPSTYISPNKHYRGTSEEGARITPVSILQDSAVPNASAQRPQLDWTSHDTVSISICEEKSGFLIKHTNYLLESAKWNTKVQRRYSDFLWLLSYLGLKYAFRLLPGLPPKTMQLDSEQLEERRLGLQRFLDLLNRHPVLSQDVVLQKFIKVPAPFAPLRKTLAISSQDEFESPGAAPDVQVDSPQTETVLTTHRDRIPEQLHVYIGNFATAVSNQKQHLRALIDHVKSQMRHQTAAFDELQSSSALLHTWGSILDKSGLSSDELESWAQSSNALASVLAKESSREAESLHVFKQVVFDALCKMEMLVLAASDLLDRVHKSDTAISIQQHEKKVLNHQQEILDLNGKLSSLPDASEAADSLRADLLKTQSLLESNSLKLAHLKQREMCLNYTLWHECQLFHIANSALFSQIVNNWLARYSSNDS